MERVFVVYQEPEYEGGGSYYGTKEILAAFKNAQDAENYINNLDKYSDYNYEAVKLM